MKIRKDLSTRGIYHMAREFARLVTSAQKQSLIYLYGKTYGSPLQSEIAYDTAQWWKVETEIVN